MAAYSELLLKYVEAGVREWVTIWDYSIHQNFDQQGRPKWPKTRRGGKILQRTNRLQSSISVEYKRSGRTIFNFIAHVNIKYGRIHQYGGYIKPKKGKALAIPISKEAQNKLPSMFPKKGSPGALFILTNKSKTKVFLAANNGKKVVKHFILLKMIYIPKREYIKVQSGDERDFARLMRDAGRAAKFDQKLFEQLT